MVGGDSRLNSVIILPYLIQNRKIKNLIAINLTKKIIVVFLNTENFTLKNMQNFFKNWNKSSTNNTWVTSQKIEQDIELRKIFGCFISTRILDRRVED